MYIYIYIYICVLWSGCHRLLEAVVTAHIEVTRTTPILVARWCAPRDIATLRAACGPIFQPLCRLRLACCTKTCNHNCTRNAAAVNARISGGHRPKCNANNIMTDAFFTFFPTTFAEGFFMTTTTFAEGFFMTGFLFAYMGCAWTNKPTQLYIYIYIYMSVRYRLERAVVTATV